MTNRAGQCAGPRSRTLFFTDGQGLGLHFDCDDEYHLFISLPNGAYVSFTEKIFIKEKIHSKTIIFEGCRFFFIELGGESPRSKFEQEHDQTDVRTWP